MTKHGQTHSRPTYFGWLPFRRLSHRRSAHFRTIHWPTSIYRSDGFVDLMFRKCCSCFRIPEILSFMRASCVRRKILCALGPVVELFSVRLGGNTPWCLQWRVEYRWFRNVDIFRSIFSHSLKASMIFRSYSWLSRTGNLDCRGWFMLRWIRLYSRAKYRELSWAFLAPPCHFFRTGC